MSDDKEQYKDWTKNTYALVFDTLARIATYFNKTELAREFYLRACEACICDGDYYGAARMAEKGSNIEGAIHHYMTARICEKRNRQDMFDRAKQLAERHGIALPRFPKAF